MIIQVQKFTFEKIKTNMNGPKAFLLLFSCSISAARMTEIYNWNTIDFDFPSERMKKEMIEGQRFIPKNNIPTGFAIWENTMFVALPRFKRGVPATLCYINITNVGNPHLSHTVRNATSPKLKAYPSWDANNEDAKKLISVMNVATDPCDRLWVLDSGESRGGKITVPNIVIYDLKTNTVVDTEKFKKRGDHNKDPIFSHIVVDVTSADCENAFAYIPDAGNNQLIVYNLKAQDSQRLKYVGGSESSSKSQPDYDLNLFHSHNYFHFSPLEGDLKIEGIPFRTQLGIYGVALSILGIDNYRTLFFNPLASCMEFAINTRILQNKTLNTMEHYYEVKRVGSRGLDSQSSASSYDQETGILFYTLVSQNAVGCWNSFSGEDFALSKQGKVFQHENLIYPAGAEIDRGRLWILSNRYPKFLKRELDESEINFRIYVGAIRSIISSTPCDEYR